jgi:hypothetical protein
VETMEAIATVKRAKEVIYELISKVTGSTVIAITDIITGRKMVEERFEKIWYVVWKRFFMK